MSFHPLSLLVLPLLGAAAEVPKSDPANLFGDPSFEQALAEGQSGGVYMFYVGSPLQDFSGAKARSGKGAVAVHVGADGKRHYFQMGGRVEPGKTFHLRAWLRSEQEGSAHLQVNLTLADGTTKPVEGDRASGPAWQERSLTVAVPADAKPECIVIIHGGSAANPVWLDDAYFGPEKVEKPAAPGTR